MMGPTLAERMREQALRLPRRQAIAIYQLAAEAARMEQFLDSIVADAAADVRALEHIRAAGHG